MLQSSCGVLEPLGLVGVAIDGLSRRLAAARVDFCGLDLPGRSVLRATTTAVLPESLVTRVDEGQQAPLSAAAVAPLQAEVSVAIAKLVTELVAQTGSDRPLAIGVLDSGWWQLAAGRASARLGLADSSLLAELTGLSVIEDFAARDLALGGRGGPLTAVPLWALLHDAKKSRVVVDLDDTTQVTYLPACCESSGLARVAAFQMTAGGELLDRLAKAMSDGRPVDDAAGRLAVQGRKHSKLIDFLLKESGGVLPAADVWEPRAWQAERLAVRLVEQAVAEDCRVADVLCSTAHGIAGAVAQAVHDRVPKTPPLEQVILTGRYRQHGLLRREIFAQLADVEVLDVEALEVEEAAIEPAIAATLAYLHLKQVPATGTQISGIQSPRVLGRLTPGTPQAWQRLLKTLAGNLPARLPLRSAI